jgi:hypothetical protein
MVPLSQRFLHPLRGQRSRRICDDFDICPDDPADACGSCPDQDSDGQCDVVDPSQVGAMIETVHRKWGRLDILVNNAGVLRDRMIWNMTEEEWDGVIQVHLKGTFACTRAAVPLMREQKSGRIINFYLHLRPGRQCGPGQLRRGQAGNRRVHQGCGPGHGQIQCDRQLHFSLCLDKADWDYPY